MGAVRGKVVFSPRAVQATALGGRWLKEERGYSPRAIRILTELLNAHVERLESGGEELGRIEELVKKAERCGVDGAALNGVLKVIRDVFEPSRRPHRHLRGGN